MSWNAIVVLGGVLAAAGVVFDKFLLPRTRSALYDRLLGYWVKLDDTAYKDLGNVFASWLISAIERTTRGSFFSPRSLLFWTVVSWLLTSAASFLDGLIIEPSAYPADEWPIPLPEFPAYFANWIFDLATFLMTMGVLRSVRDRSRTTGVFTILASAIVAALLYLGCVTTTIWTIHHATNTELPGTAYSQQSVKTGLRDILVSEHPLAPGDEVVQLEYSSPMTLADAFSITRSCIEFARTGDGRGHPVSYQVRVVTRKGFTAEHEVVMFWEPTYLWLVVAGTVFVPSVVLLTAILALLLAKAVGDIYRFSLLHVLEVATAGDPQRRPNDFAPGTLVGVVAALLAAIAKAMSTFFDVH